jgi:hypothetical protein
VIVIGRGRSRHVRAVPNEKTHINSMRSAIAVKLPSHDAPNALPRKSGTIAAVIFTVFMVIVPWPSIWLALYHAPMEDRRVYEQQIASGYLAIDLGLQSGFWDYILNEYLWGWILNLLIRDLGLSSIVAFGAISAFVVYVASKVVVKHAHPCFLLLLINPSFVNLAFSQMRIALAWGLVCVAYLIWDKFRGTELLSVALLAAACFVHTSMVVFVALLSIAAYSTRRRLRTTPFRSYVELVIAGLLAAALLGPLRVVLLGGLGDRRIDVEYLSSSVNFYIVWLILAVLLSINWRGAVINAPIAFSVSCLALVIGGLFIDVYVNRVIAIALPFFVVAIARLSYSLRIVMIAAYLGYNLVYWIYWLRVF